MIMTILEWLKRSWILLAIIIAGLIVFGDAAQLYVTLYNLSTIAMVLLLTDFLLDSRRSWGIFPTLDINEAILNAIKGSYETIHNTNGVVTRKRCGIAPALVFLSFVLLLIAILFLAVPSARAGGIPSAASAHMPVLSTALDRHWPTAPQRELCAGQVEQESSWKERATLKTSRELGRGLVQMTIAYDKSGRERFNIYRAAVRYTALSCWDWQHDPYNPRHQLIFLVLQDRNNYIQMLAYHFFDATEAWKAALVCYNAGPGRVSTRRAWAKTHGIAADRWTNGLELAHSPRENAILYGRPLWQAVNEYPRVIFTRSKKYRGMV